MRNYSPGQEGIIPNLRAPLRPSNFFIPRRGRGAVVHCHANGLSFCRGSSGNRYRTEGLENFAKLFREFGVCRWMKDAVGNGLESGCSTRIQMHVFGHVLWAGWSPIPVDHGFLDFPFHGVQKDTCSDGILLGVNGLAAVLSIASLCNFLTFF